MEKQIYTAVSEVCFGFHSFVVQDQQWLLVENTILDSSFYFNLPSLVCRFLLNLLQCCFLLFVANNDLLLLSLMFQVFSQITYTRCDQKVLRLYMLKKMERGMVMETVN